MSSSDLLVLNELEVTESLKGKELEILESVRGAYIAHLRKRTVLPHSTFLTFPQSERDRIIALPAYLDDGEPTAGVKWIASFPGNLERGIDRASALVILNSMETGRPVAVLEGSAISAARTAASAALAASVFHHDREDLSLALIGCGRINREILRFLQVVFPHIVRISLFDTVEESAKLCARELNSRLPQTEMRVARDLESAIDGSGLLVFATTSGTPYLEDPNGRLRHKTILHVSLRDISPSVVLSADNVVDDADHVCRARTSLHLAEIQTNDRRFIWTTIADGLLQQVPARNHPEGPIIVSPFGLGILDLAVARFVVKTALENDAGMQLPFYNVQLASFEAVSGAAREPARA